MGFWSIYAFNNWFWHRVLPNILLSFLRNMFFESFSKAFGLRHKSYCSCNSKLSYISKKSSSSWKKGEEKNTGVYWKISSELFGFFIFSLLLWRKFPREVPKILHIWGKQCIGLQIAYFYPITSFPFIFLREKWKKW